MSPRICSHPSQEPEKTTDAVLPLVVGGDATINILHWGIGVTESKGGIRRRGSLNEVRRWLVNVLG
ncbi:Hypothetical predicted protein, partial [Olea europaea subsp. europaea]